MECILSKGRLLKTSWVDCDLFSSALPNIGDILTLWDLHHRQQDLQAQEACCRTGHALYGNELVSGRHCWGSGSEVLWQWCCPEHHTPVHTCHKCNVSLLHLMFVSSTCPDGSPDGASDSILPLLCFCPIRPESGVLDATFCNAASFKLCKSSAAADW